MHRLKGFLTAALVAAFLAAVPASASASTGIFVDSSIFAAKYPTTVTGELPGSPWFNWAEVLNFSWKENTYKVNCGVAKYTGPTLTKAAYSFDLHAAYSECSMQKNYSSIGAVTINMNSCSYHYSELSGDWGADEIESAAAISCNEGDGITLEIGIGGCKLKVPSQTLGGGETIYSNMGAAETGTPSIMEYTTASGIEYQTVTVPRCITALGFYGTYHNGSSVADMLLRGS